MQKRIALVVLLLCALAGRRGEAHTMHFVGGHPIAAKYGGGYCLIDAPHLHIYAPDHPELYQRVGDRFVFTADPTPFGYEGEKHPFYGHHPVTSLDGEPVFCYLDGPHYHPFAAPAGPQFETKSGVAFYVGAYPPQYAKMKVARARAINAEYRPYIALRPTIEVQPPAQWQGEVWVAGPSVQINAPSVQVGAPGFIGGAPTAPSGVYIGPHVRGPSASVVIGAPGVYVAPPSVEVTGGVYFEGRGDGRGHHDNGRHNGWGKHGGGHGRD